MCTRQARDAECALKIGQEMGVGREGVVWVPGCVCVEGGAGVKVHVEGVAGWRQGGGSGLVAIRRLWGFLNGESPGGGGLVLAGGGGGKGGVVKVARSLAMLLANSGHNAGSWGLYGVASGAAEQCCEMGVGVVWEGMGESVASAVVKGWRGGLLWALVTTPEGARRYGLSSDALVAMAVGGGVGRVVGGRREGGRGGGRGEWEELADGIEACADKTCLVLVREGDEAVCRSWLR